MMNEAKKQQAPAVASPPVRQLCAFRSFVLPRESRSRSSLKTKRRAKKRVTYSLLVLCFFNHTSLRKRATGSSGDQTDQSASERRDPTGGGELLDRLERPREASRGVIRGSLRLRAPLFTCAKLVRDKVATSGAWSAIDDRASVVARAARRRVPRGDRILTRALFWTDR